MKSTLDMRSVIQMMLLWCVTLLVVLAVTDAQTPDLAGPPKRPDVFKNPQELRDYLKSLNEYFAIVGRPRFGKRAMEKRYSVFEEIDNDGNGILTPTELEYFLADRK